MDKNAWMIVTSLIGLTICMIIFPLVLTGIHTITSDANIADYTGLATFANIMPLIVFIGLIGGSGFMAFQGVRGTMNKRKSRR